VGYAQGELLPTGDGYRVREMDTHAWVEVYFTELGWVEFEPTVNQIPPVYATHYPTPQVSENELNFQRKSRFDQTSTPMAAQLVPEPTPEQNNSHEGYSYLAILLYLMGAAVLIIGLIMTGPWIWRKLPFPVKNRFIQIILSTDRIWRPVRWYIRADEIERIFLEVKWMTFLLGGKINDSATPNEQAGILIKKIPHIEHEISQLVNEYQKGVFSPHPVDIGLARQIRFFLWKHAITTLIQQWIKWAIGYNNK
jgi:hypothetical protein